MKPWSFSFANEQLAIVEHDVTFGNVKAGAKLRKSNQVRLISGQNFAKFGKCLIAYFSRKRDDYFYRTRFPIV